MIDDPQKICEAFNKLFILLLLVKKLEKTLNPMILPPSHSLIHQLHSFVFRPRLKKFTCLLAI